jgi:hypothetical protein
VSVWIRGGGGDGAPAVKGSFKLTVGSLVARFRTRDVVNVQPGAETAFAVSVIADYRGKKVDFEGVDTLKVVK